jgi:hypothetical protein
VIACHVAHHSSLARAQHATPFCCLRLVPSPSLPAKHIPEHRASPFRQSPSPLSELIARWPATRRHHPTTEISIRNYKPTRPAPASAQPAFCAGLRVAKTLNSFGHSALLGSAPDCNKWGSKLKYVPRKNAYILICYGSNPAGNAALRGASLILCIIINGLQCPNVSSQRELTPSYDSIKFPFAVAYPDP